MHHLAQTVETLEVLILSYEGREDCAITALGLDLQVPLVPVDPAFYERFRVRVMPFAFFLDPRGVVRWVGLVDTETQLSHAWQMAQVAVHEGSFSQKV
jgi:hypothetical protein